MVNYKIGDALKKGIALLNENLTETAGLDARVLLCHVLGCDKLYLTVHSGDDLPEDKAEMYFNLISRRVANEPIGYITGKKEFMSLDFKVNSNVLIPRPDTEILVERLLAEVKDPGAVVIDMCTGSGAIAVSCAKYLNNARVIGMDISRDALEIAEENAKTNGVAVEFMYHNVLEPFGETMADAVVSNPPYIPSEDIADLDADVADFEPILALDGGEDGLVFYRAIVANAPSCLKKGGMLAFEVGCGQAQYVKKMMEANFEKVATDCDLAGIERVVYGFLK